MFACLHGTGKLSAEHGGKSQGSHLLPATAYPPHRRGDASVCTPGFASLTALAFQFSPTVEQTAPDTVTFDASGLDRMFGFPQDIAAALARRASELGVKASIAIAANPDAAICAARGFSGTSIIPYGDEAKFLAPLPVALLSPTPDLQETLERWGIRRFQDLAALPPLGIAERLGPEGLYLRELASGEVARKLLPLVDPLRFEDEIELDYPVELLEPLAFVLSRLINSLAISLAARALATNELRLHLKLENRTTHERTLRLPVPTLDTKAFLKLLQLDLSQNPPAAPVVEVRMAMNPVKPQSAQSGLFVLAAPEPVKLELTIARLKSIVGPDRVGSPSLIDTHRPDAFRMGPAFVPSAPATAPQFRLSIRLFRPPRAAHVALASGHPSFVTAGAIRGRILDLAGPWRTSGDWWTADPWLRDEWDIALSDGALYRLYCEPRGWFVEGSYD
jgi:protein ImuB